MRNLKQTYYVCSGDETVCQLGKFPQGCGGCLSDLELAMLRLIGHEGEGG